MKMKKIEIESYRIIKIRMESDGILTQKWKYSCAFDVR